MKHINSSRVNIGEYYSVYYTEYRISVILQYTHIDKSYEEYSHRCRIFSVSRGDIDDYTNAGANVWFDIEQQTSSIYRLTEEEILNHVLMETI